MEGTLCPQATSPSPPPASYSTARRSPAPKPDCRHRRRRRQSARPGHDCGAVVDNRHAEPGVHELDEHVPIRAQSRSPCPPTSSAASSSCTRPSSCTGYPRRLPVRRRRPDARRAELPALDSEDATASGTPSRIKHVGPGVHNVTIERRSTPTPTSGSTTTPRTSRCRRRHCAERSRRWSRPGDSPRPVARDLGREAPVRRTRRRRPGAEALFRARRARVLDCSRARSASRRSRGARSTVFVDARRPRSGDPANLDALGARPTSAGGRAPLPRRSARPAATNTISSSSTPLPAGGRAGRPSCRRLSPPVLARGALVVARATDACRSRST